MTIPTRLRAGPLAITTALVLLTLALVPTTARAQQSDAAAEALFDDGRRLMDEGQFASACAKFEASYRLDSALGTLLNLAQCRARNRQYASAWARARAVISDARKAGDARRERAAIDIVANVEPMLSRITIDLAASPPSGLVVERDGIVLDAAALGSALPVDLGEHVVRARAPGKRDWTSTVVVSKEKETVTVRVPILGDLPSPAAKPLQAPGTESAGSGQRTVALIAGGAAVVGIGIGTYFGFAARFSWSEAKLGCSPDLECDHAGAEAGRRAKAQATVATIAFVAAGVALAGGVVLWFTGGPSSRGAGVARVGVSPGLGGGSLVGRF